MNLYVVVEGERVEVEVYRHWIAYQNPQLKSISHISEFADNNYFIFAGYGYPHYFDTIKRAAEDVVSNPKIDVLVIAIDSEEMTYEEKYKEVMDCVSIYVSKIRIAIIIQHFCFET